MDNSQILSIIQTVLILILELLAPILTVAVAVGLIVSIFQTVTSIQEATLTFVPKIVACVLTLIIMLPWMLNLFITTTNELFAKIPSLIH